MLQELNVPRAEYETMLRHLQDAYPLEACGILAGSKGDVFRLYAVDNHLRSPVAFEMDPRQQLEAMLDLEDAGLQLVAIYHSHPNGPQTPSPTDVAQAFYPNAAQVIVSLADRQRPVARAFMIRDGRVHEIALNIV